MESNDRCSKCLDAIMYCTCSYSDPNVVDPPFYSNASFSVFRGDEEVEWDSEHRSISGDRELLSEVMSQLNGEYVEVLKPGFCLWLDFREPFAVRWAAENIEGCTFSASAPDWSRFSKPGRIY